MKTKNFLIGILLLILILSIGSVCAEDLDNSTLNQVNGNDNSSSILSNSAENVIGDNLEEITVNNWDELQYYCYLNDGNYVLKLKENTNFYPTDVDDVSYQIQVNNNVTIIGSSGAYFGDASANARSIKYLAISVSENSGHGITLKNVTFKWISSKFEPNAIFLQMGGNVTNTVENCIFNNIFMTGGHSSILHIMKGDVVLTNCSFTNCTTDFGCLSVYNPDDDPTALCTRARGEVNNCYFEGNYARTEPGCINNCGILVVRNSTFYRNAAFWWAGAIHTHGGANTTIYDSNFTDNVAGWNGGALYTYSYLQIYNTIFVGNNCTTNNGGGAIGACKYLHAPYIYIKDSLFNHNENLCWSLDELSTTGTGRGGAISIMDEGGITVLNTTFISNSASIGTAICAIQHVDHGSPDVTLIGNRFINHTRVGDALVIRLAHYSKCILQDNYYSGNSIEFSKLKLTADDRIGNEVTLHIDASLKNANYYDSDILDKATYDVYMDGEYIKTVNSTDFTLNIKNIIKAQVYVVPSISNSTSNEVSVGLPKEYIHVSQKSGNNNNNGSKDNPVATISKAIELANSTGNIKILDGTFSETNLNVNYNLSIICENNVVISANGNIFNIGNFEFEIVNGVFRNCKKAVSSDERIINHEGGFLKLKNCTFESNSYESALIESGGTVEASNLNFKSNTGILILANTYTVLSSVFDSNIANIAKRNALIKSTAGTQCFISNSAFTNNNVKEGCLYYNANNNNQKTLTVTNVVFSKNSGDRGTSGIYMSTGGVLWVKSSLFINNTDSGAYGAVIFSSSEIHVSDSIFLGNNFANSNNAIFNSKSNINLKKIYCSGNWFGNTQDNYNIAPPISPLSHCDYWLFLTTSANATSIFQQETAIVTFDLNNKYDKDGNVSYWDSSNLPTVELDISTTGGNSSQDKVTIVYGIANTLFTLTDVEGSLTASYNGVYATVNFTESDIDPNMFVSFDDAVSVGETTTIEITLHYNATGTLTLNYSNKTLSKQIKNATTSFNIDDLSVGENTILISYSGDGYYAASNKNISITVNKLNSTTNISVGEIKVGEDVILTIEVSPNVTGNVTLIMNNEEENLTLTNSKANYTINSISRGDYYIVAIYNGNDKYLPSQNSIGFSVDKLNTTISANVADSTYGESAVIYIVLNDTAYGNVTVSVDGKNYTNSTINGSARVTISGLSAGDKVASVFYSGNNVFNSNNCTSSFNVAKATTTLTITVNDIMVGDDEKISVTVLSGVSGNITITCGDFNVTKNIPLTGKVSLELQGLSFGVYDVSAILSSDNYLTVQNSTQFKVSNYNTPQWSNEGYDSHNTGKSPYETNSNGAIIWNNDLTGEAIGNLVIDSNGNIYVVTTSGIYSFDNDGNQLWYYGIEVGGNYSGLAVSRDFIIAPEVGNTLHLINQSTGKKYGSIRQGSSRFAPVVDSNANLYIAGEYQYESGDYNLVIAPFNLWKSVGDPRLICLGKSSPKSAPVIVNDYICVVACNDSLKIVDILNKQIIASIYGNTNGVRPVAGSGNMIYGVLDDDIVEINSEGSIIWKTKVTGGIGKYLALNEEQGLYFINSLGNLYKYDLVNGNESLVSNLTFTSGMLIGNDGNIYIGSKDMFYAFDSENNLLWKSYIGNQVIGNPVMGNNGIIYLTTTNGIYALSYAKMEPSTFNASSSNITFGETAIITVCLPIDAMGSVSCGIGNDIYYGAVNNGVANIEIPNLSGGKNIVDVTYLGDNKYESISKPLEIQVNRLNTYIELLNNTIYYSDNLITVLKDINDNAVAGETVLVSIDNKNYALTTDDLGRIYLNLKLNRGSYVAVINFNDSIKYCASNLTSTVNVLGTIQANDMLRGYNSGVDFKALLLTNDGNPLANAQITFLVNGVPYNATTNVEGVAILNMKLKVGVWDIVVLNPLSGENSTYKSTIVKRITDNYNLKMNYLDGSYFKVRIVGDDGNYVGEGQVVKFKIGIDTLTAKTDSKGYASFKVKHVPKTYTVMTTYKDFTVSNKLFVKQILKAKDLSKKKSKYYKYSAALKTSKGKAIVGKKIIFKIKGKRYTAKTNKKGIATIKIKLKLKVGKYKILVRFSKTTIIKKLTIKRR